ncbi:pre-mRNA-processing protein 40a [Phtheirospermum japonicum]|uniref:Pre-mRNA-processing protein 40a n=1 Tax=Phtheirospermum japonicum TaxID=374723 RepID=A0A830BN68_9LAMI|nr:pre-mRNA-processing protein 40a [Phtheirospermum japonicum]
MASNPPSNGSQWPHPASGSMAPQSFVHPYNMQLPQFRPAAHSPQAQQFIPPQATQQYHQAGQPQNLVMHHGQNQPPQFSQPMQQFLQRPTQPGPAAPPSHPQSSMPMTSGVPQPSYTYAPSSFGLPQSSIGMPSQFQPSSQMSTPLGSTGVQTWLHSSQTTPVVAPLQQAFTISATVPAVNGSSTVQIASDWQEFEAADGRRYYYNKATKQSSWEKPAELMTPLEHEHPGRRILLDGNERVDVKGRNLLENTKKRLVLAKTEKGSAAVKCYAQATELFESCFLSLLYSRDIFDLSMLIMIRADASTVWKEFTTPEGRKYYYNKETKQSKWTIPDELKLAREEAEKAAAGGGHSVMVATVPTTPRGTTVEEPSATVNLASSTTSVIAGVTSSPAPVTPVGSDANAPSVMDSDPPAVPALQTATAGALGVSVGETVTPSPSEVSGSSGVPVISSSSNSMPMTSTEYPSPYVGGSPLGGASVQDTEDEKKGIAVAGKLNVKPVEEKSVDDEPYIYATKQEAKNAFKALLESANVEADWTWDQAMRVIINDKRYGALKTLGERKQAFNEYLMQRKKVEAEERRLRQRKAKEEFMTMLEEAEELTSSTRWSKAVIMFEDDKRFKAVELEADREDLFRNYLVDLHKKEKAKAQEEYRRNRQEFRQFLESCAFIKVDSQWRKIQDQLEDDERCTRLDKIERLDIFQDYIRELEKEDEEQKKRQKEQLRRTERKNRDLFRKMMEEHIANGTLTAKTYWRDYCQKVKDSEAYEAVASNISGSTPKDLFEDVVEELEKKYDEDKAHIKDALKQEKITVASTWTFEDFKSSIEESIGSISISDINLQLVYEDLIDRAKEKEEKEAKKRKRQAKDFTDKLSTFKEINALSTWEECKQLVEDTSEYRSLGEESLCMEAFEECVSRLQEKTKEKERKREEEKAKKEKDREEKEKRKDKDRREKDREKERDKDWDREKEKEKGKDSSKKDEDIENMDDVESYGHKEEKRREKDKDRKHRRRRQSSVDDASSDRDDKEEPKNMHIRLNQTVKVSIKDTKGTTAMDLDEVVATRSLKMVNSLVTFTTSVYYGIFLLLLFLDMCYT